MTDIIAALLVGISVGLAVYVVGITWLEEIYKECDDE